jgi:hypothetical protein
MNLFEKLADKAAPMRLRFLVIGGHAVNFHGFQRGTEDADILISRPDVNPWRELIPGMGFRLVHEQETFLQFGPYDAAEWDLDLMIVSAETFERLFAAAETNGPDDRSVRYVSFEHLIALKAHALKHGQGLRSLKDLTDVSTLLKLRSVRPEAEWLRAVVQRNGTPEMHERIRKLITE